MINPIAITRLAAALHRLKLQLTDYAILNCVAARAQSKRQLAHELTTNYTTIHKSVNRLYQKQLIILESGGHGGARIIHINARGAELLSNIAKIVSQPLYLEGERGNNIDLFRILNPHLFQKPCTHSEK